MSELINNGEQRRDVLKALIGQLHDGKSVDEVKEEFQRTFGGVSAAEIADVEQTLISEGMPVSEIQRLCDVHAAVFKGSIEEIHRAPLDASSVPGHPVQLLKAENRALERLIDESLLPHLERWLGLGDPEAMPLLISDLVRLAQVDIHFKKKENLLFPRIEKKGITAPPKVMWGVDDEIRALVKDARLSVDGDPAKLIREKVDLAVERIREMIYKEENILLPMILEKLDEEEWKSIARESKEFGYCLLDKVPQWSALVEAAASTAAVDGTPARRAHSPALGTLVMPSGSLMPKEIVKILDTLPLDMTFVDKDDKVKYFSQGKDRVFERTVSILGRDVANCHPPQSVHVVEKILDSFKNGEKDHEDFWIRMGPKFVYIRYYAVRSDSGEYLGTLEVTQDIGPIMALEGEKRLMS
jgi:DUF438 domain-containing protein